MEESLFQDKYKVYKITCRATGLAYIGITSRPLRERWNSHISDALSGRSKLKLHNALRKYGPDNFDFEHIASCKSFDDLLLSEMLLISQNNSKKMGYNCTDGGMVALAEGIQMSGKS